MDGVTQLWSTGDRATKEPWQWECGYGVIRREWRWEQSREGNMEVATQLGCIRKGCRRQQGSGNVAMGG